MCNTSCLPVTDLFDGLLLCTFKPVFESVVKGFVFGHQPPNLPTWSDSYPCSCWTSRYLPSFSQYVFHILTALINSSLPSGVFARVLKTVLVTPRIKQINSSLTSGVFARVFKTVLVTPRIKQINSCLPSGVFFPRVFTTLLITPVIKHILTRAN